MKAGGVFGFDEIEVELGLALEVPRCAQFGVAPARRLARLQVVDQIHQCVHRDVTLKITTKQRIANSASNTNPGVKLPVACRTAPRTSGGKNPPSPPAAPTIPVTAPTDCGKYSGTSLNTAPLPSPMAAAIPNAPMVNVTIIGQARKTAIADVAGKTHSKIFRPPIRSASIPPTGRIAVASTTNPAVRNPAAPGVSLNISVKKVGR